MLPRVVPEPQYPGYDQNGQPRPRYTTTWAQRALGIVPQGSYPNSIVPDKYWEPKNTNETMCWAFFLALFELCCALAFSCLAIYHWSEPKMFNDPDKPWDPTGASSLLVAGLSGTVVAALAVVAFFPGKRGRVTKRLVVILSFPALIQLVGILTVISITIGQQTNENQTVNGFLIAEIILASLMLMLAAVLLYPASEGCVPYEKQTSTALRAIGLSISTVFGAIVLIYFCFSIYGIHAASKISSFDGYLLKRTLSTIAVTVTSLLLVGVVGSFVAFGLGIRPHIIPSLVINIAAITSFLQLLPQYVIWMNSGGRLYDWHDNAYVGLFALNCLTLIGLVVHVCMGVAFMYY